MKLNETVRCRFLELLKEKSLSEISIGEKNYTLLNIFMHKWV